MDLRFWGEPAARWALAVMIGFPALMVVLGEILFRLERHRHPMAATLRLVRSLILPALAAFLIFSRVIPLDRGGGWLRLIETVLLVLVINAVLSLLNVLLFAGASKDSWQARTPRLLVDLGRLVLVLIGGSVVLSQVWGYDLGALVTALGVGSLVLGLALQDALGNVFAGLLLVFERPLTVGDSIKVEGLVGRVVEVNWRAIHLLTAEDDLVIVPNAVLAKGAFTNYDRPTRRHAELVSLRFSPYDPPNEVRGVLAEAALGVEHILDDPPPVVLTDGYSDNAAEYKVRIHVAEYDLAEATRSEFLTRVWYASRRRGLTLAHPIRFQLPAAADGYQTRDAIPSPSAVAAVFPQFGLNGIEADGRDWSRVALQRYSRGERVLNEGEKIPGIFLILAGRAELSVRAADGASRPIAAVEQGEFFGERALLPGQSSEQSVVAVEDLAVLILPSETLHAILEGNPRLTSEIGLVMEARRAAALAFRKPAGPGRPLAPSRNGGP